MLTGLIPRLDTHSQAYVSWWYVDLYTMHALSKYLQDWNFKFDLCEIYHHVIHKD